MTTQTPKQLTAEAVAELTGGRLEGAGDLVVVGMQIVEEAGAEHLVCLGAARYAKAWVDCPARVALVADGLDVAPEEGRALIVVPDVDLAAALVLEQLAPDPPKAEPGVHPAATVDAAALVDPSATIGPNCYVGPGATIGPGTVLHAGAVVLDESRVGGGSTLWPGVVIRERCVIGDGCILHPNVTIGSDGYGYRPAPDGRGLVKIPQIGNVEVGNGVEIGAGTCIDRAKYGSTRIGDGTKIDNLCQIAHNCQIGRCVIIAACAPIGGSVKIGDGAVLGGHVGAADHLEIGAGAMIGGGSVVYQDVPPGARWWGIPARDGGKAKRQITAIQRLPEALKRIRKLERGGGEA